MGVGIRLVYESALEFIFLSQQASENGPRGNHIQEIVTHLPSLNIRVSHIIYKVQQQTSCCLTSPLIALIPTLSTHPSSSQTRPSSPVSGFDGPEEVGAADWKR